VTVAARRRQAEVTTLLHVGPAGAESGGGAGDVDDSDLAVFVDRLAAAGDDRPTTLAKQQIRRVIAAGYSPPGLRRLAESLAASVSELPPSQRHPTEDAGSVVSAVRSSGLVVLEGFDAAAVAEAVSALVADGRRVVVTGSTVAELAEVRHSLPACVTARVVDQLPPMSPGEVRELRRLLAMTTPERRARPGQLLPGPSAFPAPAEVDQLCARAGRGAVGWSGAGLIPVLLADLDAERREAVTSVARRVSGSLGGMPPREGGEWAWRLLSDLIYGTNRSVFDQMTEDVAQSVAALERARSAPGVQVAAPLPPGAADALRRYREFLVASGGRARSYFRPAVARDVQPVLRMLRVGGRVPETTADVQRVIDHLEVGERLSRIDTHCARIRVPAPRDEAELSALADGMLRVAAAARSVSALRHDVLFIAPDSPLSVPDVDTAEQVASAMLEYAEHGSAAEAARVLERMASELELRCAASAMAPEHRWAVAALRAQDAAGYAAALDALGAARREAQDEARQAELLRSLGEGAPRLAEAWATLGNALGLACFQPIDGLLSSVPEADAADAVIVLGAARLGVERLLLTAVAPRLIAAVAPGRQPEGSPSMLSVLQRAAALVIRRPVAAANGRVVPIAQPAARPQAAPVGQAGA
jgi:hypothetical protein